MNAQSSRSHAIFSLTLTQKKYTGSGIPPRSSSPLPLSGRSPSRIARPGSLYTNGSSPTAARVSSPTPVRPATPSFQVAMGRGGGLRPSSALGLRPPDSRSDNADDDSGEWTTIVSKFHFVDLAGSERVIMFSVDSFPVVDTVSSSSGLRRLVNVSRRAFQLTVVFWLLAMSFLHSETRLEQSLTPTPTFPTVTPNSLDFCKIRSEAMPIH